MKYQGLQATSLNGGPHYITACHCDVSQVTAPHESQHDLHDSSSSFLSSFLFPHSSFAIPPAQLSTFSCIASPPPVSTPSCVMSLRRVSSRGDMLSRGPSGSTRFESFPPLFITQSDVLNTPTLLLESVPSRALDRPRKQAFSRWLILFLSCLLLFGNYYGNLG